VAGDLKAEDRFCGDVEGDGVVEPPCVIRKRGLKVLGLPVTSARRTLFPRYQHHSPVWKEVAGHD